MVPHTLMYVSSIYQLRPTRSLRLRRRFSARAGVSFASHSRTASLVAQEPGHYEGNDVARVLCLIQHAIAAFAELLATPAAEPAVALCSPLRSFADRG